MRGRVTWFNAEKGYGFIHADDEDFFVHYTALADIGFKTLDDGQMVEFDIADGPKGKQAANVRKVTE